MERRKALNLVREGDVMFALYEQEFPIWASRPQCPPPDWRWRRACYLVDQGRHVSRKRDDPVLRRTVQYIRELRRCSTERRLRTLAKRHPDLFLACQVAQESTRRPLEIKARVMARQTDRGIAWRVGLPVPTVAAFLGLFFDVRNRIDARSAAGSEEALEEFRTVLRANPEIYRLLGDLGQHARRCLIDLIAGGSVTVRETALQRAEELRQDLLTAGDTPLERLAADQVVTSWLDVNFQQIGLAQDHAKETLRLRWEQRLDRAQRRHLAAVTALAEVRSHLRRE